MSKVRKAGWPALVLAAGMVAGCGTAGRGPVEATSPARGGVMSESIALASADGAGPSRSHAERPRDDGPSLQEALVVEGWMTVKVDDVRAAAAAIRARTERAGGRVLSERLSGAEMSWSGTLKLRLPPGDVEAMSSWLGELGEVTSRRLQGTDVSRELFDQEIALENLELTLDRLRALLDREGLQMNEILAIEQEMTRLRGEIERIKGEQRWLRDRVALATLDITLERREGAVLGPRALMYPGARATMLTLLDPDGRSRNRLGAGVVVHPFAPGGTEEAGGRMTLEADVFAGPDGEGTAALLTIGGAAYSDFLGRGRNLVGNPYLGMRVGYAYLDRSAFAFAATAGIELLKTEYVLLDLNLRGVGLAGRGGFDPALVTAANAVFAF
jgi:hypothetical protein